MHQDIPTFAFVGALTRLGSVLRKNEVGQRRERMRRIGVPIVLAADDPEAQARLATFLQGLQPLSWSVGSNFRIDTVGPQAVPTTFASSGRIGCIRGGHHPGRW
jgi:hypothetical protein